MIRILVLIIMLFVTNIYGSDLSYEYLSDFDDAGLVILNNNNSSIWNELTLKVEGLDDLSVTATASEINQVCDGVGATVTTANLDSLTDGSDASALHTHDDEVGWQLLTTYTISNNSSIDITSQIDSTYDQYVLVINSLVPATDSKTLEMLVSLDNGSTWETSVGDYDYMVRGFSSSGGGYSQFTANTDNMRISGLNSLGNNTGENYNAMIFILNPNDTSKYAVFRSEVTYVNNAGVGTFLEAVGSYMGAVGAIDAVRLIMDSGNLTSGTVKVYGIVK